VGVEVELHAFLVATLDGGEWSALRLGHFTPKVKAPCTPRIGGWMGPRDGLDAMAFPSLHLLGIEHRPSSP